MRWSVSRNCLPQWYGVYVRVLETASIARQEKLRLERLLELRVKATGLALIHMLKMEAWRQLKEDASPVIGFSQGFDNRPILFRCERSGRA